MNEFKGTKGKWEVNEYHDGNLIGICVESNSECVTLFDTGSCGYIDDEEMANAKLIASAPEMFKEIQETIIDLKILRNQIIDANKTNHLFDGMPELIEKWIERKEQLVKKATEL